MWWKYKCHLDERGALSEQEVVLDEFLELGEVPRVPLPHAHREGVDVLVHLIQQGDGLDDHVVGAAGVELNLRVIG